MILTSAARSGGEVRITEAERPRRIYPGQSGYQAGIAARSAHMRGHCAVRPVCEHYLRVCRQSRRW
jgi:ribosome modulation factor